MTDIYNRFDPSKNYERHLFRADKVLQSAEFNELQSAVHHRMRGISDVLFTDGDIVRDAGISINVDTGETQLEAGAIYLAGAVRGVAPATLTITLSGVVIIGIYLQSAIITELQDPALRNPAAGTRGYMEPGAAREQLIPVWGLDGDDTPGDFYPVYTVENGLLYAKEPPPTLDAVSQAIARYDRDSTNSNYVVSGLRLTALADSPEGYQVYSLGEGRARVHGFGVQLGTSRRIHYPTTPVLRYINSEPHLSDTADEQRINLDRYPVTEILEVRITAEKTVNLNHGTFAGAADPLPDPAVTEIVSVTQGETTYTSPADYILAAGKVDWTPEGNEPAPGSTYTVTYRHITAVPPVDDDNAGYSVTGAVPGTLVFTDYRCALPRIDRLCLNEHGEHLWIEGVSTDYDPVRPPVPAHLISIAQVVQTWDESRRIINDGVRTVPMSDIEAMNQRMDLIIDLVAQQNLKSDISTREAAAKKGVFVDPFLDDTHRDHGEEQTAAVFDGVLTLPIQAAASACSSDLQVPALCSYNHGTVLSQTWRTGTMKINPYMSFGVLPGVATLNPAIDRWTEVQTIWASPVTRTFYAGTGNVILNTQRSTSVQLVRTTRALAATLRETPVGFVVEGFGAGENLLEITFDGIPVDALNDVLVPVSLSADAEGIISGNFVVPANIPAGSKRVTFTGQGGSNAETTFIGEGIVETQTQQEVTSLIRTLGVASRVYLDPLAQTFSLGERQQITSVELFVTAVGSTPIFVELRETQVGMPTTNILAAAQINPGDITTGAWNRWVFDLPVDLMADTEYALVVLCNDPVGEVAVAELGKFDATAQRWITSQPYNIGVLLSSSNAVTWTAHQDKDLTFRLLGASFTQAERIVSLGTLDAEDVTDLIALLPAIQPSTGADCELLITLPTSPTPQTVSASDRQVIRLGAPLSGEISVSARLRATDRLGAILLPGTQLILGELATTANYISRAISADAAGCRVQVIFDAFIPSGAGVTVDVGGIDGQPWEAAEQYGIATPLGNGVFEYQFRMEDVELPRIRTRLTLTGHAGARPFVSNLRVIVTETE